MVSVAVTPVTGWAGWGVVWTPTVVDREGSPCTTDQTENCSRMVKSRLLLTSSHLWTCGSMSVYVETEKFLEHRAEIDLTFVIKSHLQFSKLSGV